MSAIFWIIVIVILGSLVYLALSLGGIYWVIAALAAAITGYIESRL